MWSKIWEPFIKNTTFFQQFRTTYVVKRIYPAPLFSSHRQPRLRKRFRVYDQIQTHKTTEHKPLAILLQKYVGDLGRPGEIVTVKDKKARLLLLNKSAVYPSPENLAKSKLEKYDSYSSKHAGATVSDLSKFVLDVTMNMEEKWELEPWHIRVAFRKAFVNVPEYAFTMPKGTISGPDMNLEQKEFYITVTINNTETVPVRCRIHHWATELDNRLPILANHRSYPTEPIFSEDKEFAKNLPEITSPVETS